MACKKGQCEVVELFKAFGINLNVQLVDGMTLILILYGY